MRVFLDTNIVLDVLLDRQGLVADFTKSEVVVLTPAEFLAKFPEP